VDPEAQAGLDAILEGQDFNYGLPLSLVDRQSREQGYTADKLWRVFGFLPSPPWRNGHGRSLPLAQSLFARQGAWVVNGNCFACHAGVVAGQVVAGLGNAQLDAVSFKAEGEALLDKWNRPLVRFFMRRRLLTPAEFAQLGGYVDFLDSVALPAVDAVSRGENHGPWVVWRQIARMSDPARGFSTYPAGTRAPLERLLDRPLPPVDPNPWWNLKYKARAFWTRDVTPKSYATFALNLMDPAPGNTAGFPERMRRTAAELALARATQAPVYPRRADVITDLARRGQALFHGEQPLADGTRLACAGCHGTYDDEGRVVNFPERDLIPANVLGTDAAYASILHDELRPLYEHFARSPFAPTGADAVRYPPVVGYAPPPLKGIWASAPYFHNGSVPTVAAVLDSRHRPSYWARSADPWAYDHVQLGLQAESVTREAYLQAKQRADWSGEPLSDAALLYRRIYSTADFGKKNSGHPFGDRMNAAERAAVVEYLKLL
jgi:mono/diheme cytochrome c family protein